MQSHGVDGVVPPSKRRSSTPRHTRENRQHNFDPSGWPCPERSASPIRARRQSWPRGSPVKDGQGEVTEIIARTRSRFSRTPSPTRDGLGSILNSIKVGLNSEQPSSLCVRMLSDAAPVPVLDISPRLIGKPRWPSVGWPVKSFDSEHFSASHYQLLAVLPLDSPRILRVTTNLLATDITDRGRRLPPPAPPATP